MSWTKDEVFDFLGEQPRTDRVASCCHPPASAEGSAALDEIREHETPPEVAALRSAGFRLLLDEGHPIPTVALATASGLDATQVHDILAGRRAQGRVQLDDAGRLIGIAGLTIEPTRHQLHIGETTRWTWCALDAVGILGALRTTGTVRSTDPRTDNPVEIEFIDGEPQGETTVFILGGYDGDNVVEEWCPLVNFFATNADADAWVHANGLEGDIVSVTRIAADAADMWRPVIDLDAPQVC